MGFRGYEFRFEGSGGAFYHDREMEIKEAAKQQWDEIRQIVTEKSLSHNLSQEAVHSILRIVGAEMAILDHIIAERTAEYEMYKQAKED